MTAAAMVCPRTKLLGVSGCFIGGAIDFFLHSGSIIQSSGWIGSVFGTMILLVICVRQGKFIEYDR